MCGDSSQFKQKWFGNPWPFESGVCPCSSIIWGWGERRRRKCLGKHSGNCKASGKRQHPTFLPGEFLSRDPTKHAAGGPRELAGPPSSREKQSSPRPAALTSYVSHIQTTAFLGRTWQLSKSPHAYSLTWWFNRMVRLEGQTWVSPGTEGETEAQRGSGLMGLIPFGLVS